ncbi:hypothetical protein [Pseudanabaena sp. FACHB-2040]|uniref:hypothetical protein n=1 Tax=Pseudanabaena sp. FACHB-2040 TaxID=2692859 RepID=UPI001689177D|nr:hypothetical protein [Pseudanabaena sp. FACHB-2040]MBD2256857.1 hypothetical protein [Pseudanabaena sp. FACHB-2040]
MFQSTDSGAQPPTVFAELSPHREKAHIVVYGSLIACDRIIKNLYILHFAEPNDWTDPLPTGRPNEWMRMLTKHLLIE